MSDVVLRVEGLTRRYGDLVAVDDLTLDVREGEEFGFLGPNGAGKTTSIDMMCGLLRPDAGRILLKGAPLDGSRRPTPWWRSVRCSPLARGCATSPSNLRRCRYSRSRTSRSASGCLGEGAWSGGSTGQSVVEEIPPRSGR